MTKQKEALLKAYNDGYRCDEHGTVWKDSRIIKGSVDSIGYLRFSIRKNDKNTTPVFIHRLQAYCKFGDKMFEEGILVRHMDDNPLNNSWDNINIGSPSDNMMDKPLEVRLRCANIATRTMQNSIRSESERFEIYDLLQQNVPYSQIINKYGVTKGTLSYMKNHSKEYLNYTQ